MAGESPRSAPIRRAVKAIRTVSAGTSISRSTGAGSLTSDAARWAIWRATFWARRIWRCNWDRRRVWSAFKKEGTSDFMFPKKSMIRYRLSGAGFNMPPVKLFWYDGLKEAPKIEGVPEGETTGRYAVQAVPPSRPRGRRGCRGRRRPSSPDRYTWAGVHLGPDFRKLWLRQDPKLRCAPTAACLSATRA